MFEQSEKARLDQAELEAQTIVALPDLEAEAVFELPPRELLTQCGCGGIDLSVSLCVAVGANVVL